MYSHALLNLFNVNCRFVAHVPIPTQKDIEEALLRRKKQELLEMYALDGDMEVRYLFIIMTRELLMYHMEVKFPCFGTDSLLVIKAA
jgi:hypothetical protein